MNIGKRENYPGKGVRKRKGGRLEVNPYTIKENKNSRDIQLGKYI